MGPHLAVFGTQSDVGKSTLVAALCRLLQRAGRDVAPFKAQNMSNNSAVAPGGGEIGRAQYLQALAARITPTVDHNPILLKPASDNCSQIVVQGVARGNTDAAAYFRSDNPLRAVAAQSLDRLLARHQVVVIEGAGSCAEVNLRDRDFVNFETAHRANARVLLVADIDRGGVFAQVLGTLAVLSPQDRRRVVGVVVNKFRGDRRLFDDGVRYLEHHTGLPVLGVVPYLYGLNLDAEDALPVERQLDPPHLSATATGVAVIRLPHISNFTDFDPLASVPGLGLHYLARPRDLSAYACVILPGSKSVLADRQWLADVGWEPRILDYHRRGGRLFGVCGGFQMLGEHLLDPHATESPLREALGLGLVPASTVLQREKTVRRVRGTTVVEGARVEGYEIHLGATDCAGPPLFWLEADAGAGERWADGVRDEGRRIWGTYLHGALDTSSFLAVFLEWLAPHAVWALPSPRAEVLEAELDRWADHVAGHLDWPTIADWCDPRALV
jgi:adenosylcobyric acid synthase